MRGGFGHTFPTSFGTFPEKLTSVFIHPTQRSIHPIQSVHPLVARQCYIRLWHVISTLRIWDNLRQFEVLPFPKPAQGWSCKTLWKDLEHRWKFRCSCQRFRSRNDNWLGAMFYNKNFTSWHFRRLCRQFSTFCCWRLAVLWGGRAKSAAAAVKAS